MRSPAPARPRARVQAAERQYDYARRRANILGATSSSRSGSLLAGAGIIALATEAPGATFEARSQEFKRLPCCCGTGQHRGRVGLSRASRS